MVFFCYQKCAEIPIYILFFEHQPNFAKKNGPKNDNFQVCQNTDYINPVLLQLPGVFQLVFMKPTTLMSNKKHNWKSGNNKDKKNGFQRENKTENPKKDKGWMKQTLQLNLLMLFLSWNKSKENRKRKKERKQGSKIMPQRKTRRKKERK